MNLRSLFGPKRMVALDIGSHTIKLAQFLRKKRKPFLEKFALLPVPDECVEQGELVNLDPLVKILPDFIRENTLLNTVAVDVAMGGRCVTVKKIEIPSSEEEIRDDLVHVEASQNLLFSIDEVNYDYEIMKSPPSQSEDRINVLLMAAKKDAVEKCEQLILDSGFQCNSINMRENVLCSCVRLLNSKVVEGQTTLVLDIGKSGTSFIVLHESQLIFVRYMMIGSEFHTNDLLKEMNVDYKEAESLKLSYIAGNEVPPEVESIMKKSDEYFCDEIFVGSEYFKNQYPTLQFSHCYVTGGGSQSKNLVQMIGKKFDISAQILDPFEQLQYDSLLGDSIDNIKHFSSAVIGLYLGGL